MKKLFILFAATIFAASISAKTIYLNTGGSSLWNQANAVFFIHSWGAEENDALMSLVSGDIYSANIPDGNNALLFVRMPAGSTAIDWAGKWNQTNDMNIPDGKNMYTITGWGAGDGNWSTYGGGDPVTPPVTPSADAYWYWKGYVDNTPIENENDGGKFDEGISSIDVSEAGYIFVIYQAKDVAGVQYMTDGWQDFNPQHVTLTNCGVCNNGNSMHIGPGSHTLYLYDNEDGTVELSIVEIPGKKLMGKGVEGIEDTVVKSKAHKMIIDGQLRIVRGNKVFDATGRQLE